MNTTQHSGSVHRDRALQRLRAITIGTALTGIAAVLGFGGLAAATYTGHSTTAPATAGSSTSAAGSSATASGSSSGAGVSSGSEQTSGGTTFGTSGLPQITVGSRGSGQVTTGGS